ncbi:MAG: hypothetical protein HYZ23_10215 [Chloroflexi bacterium]|nr:hypothetical protein [Chloroflexota bacterium]
MESSTAAIAALLFIVLIVGINFVMYGIVRGATRSGSRNIFESLGKALNPPNRKKEDSMDELRKQMEDLEKAKNNPDSNLS